MTTQSGALRRRYVDELISKGVLRDPAWDTVFNTVAREQFCPIFSIRGSDAQMITMDPYHERWLETIYSDSALVVTESGIAGHPLATSSQPSVMAAMLEALELDDDSTVLEVGCGTGYNAALLSCRVGAHNVVTVERYLKLAEYAAAALAGNGFDTRVEVGDAFTDPPPGPFDRIIVTCNPGRVPPALIDALRDGGTAVIPIGSVITVLTKTGNNLTGRVLESEASFTPDITLALSITDNNGPWKHNDTALWDDMFDPQLRTLASLTTPHAVHFWDTDIGQYFIDDRYGNVAKVDRDAGTVQHQGPRNIWAQCEAVASLWNYAGRPARDQWVLAVDADGVMVVTSSDGSPLTVVP